jgi:hypothetical protein
MDIGSAVKPTGSPASFGPVRPDPVATRQAVPTELPSSQSVTAPTDSAAARNDSANVPSPPTVTHNVVIDPATRQVVYRVVDDKSGDVISQAPDQRQLQLAYTEAVRRAVAQGQARTDAQGKADLAI